MSHPEPQALPRCEPCVIQCEGAQLLGILHVPAQVRPVGVIVIVGGPQYRIGSHRQFILLARTLAQAGYPVLRFDYRGMGDSEGELRGFEHVAVDVRCAVDALLERLPQVRQVVLWGLCDGASAASFYAAGDPRVRGLVLLNPWVRSAEPPARALLSSYYLKRLFNRHAWAQLLRQPAKLGRALRNLTRTVKDAAKPDIAPPTAQPAPGPAAAGERLLFRVAAGLSAFRGNILVVISTADMTGGEFLHYATHYAGLRPRLARRDVTWHRMKHADHTFSTAAWRDQVARWTCDWLEGLPPA